MQRLVFFRAVAVAAVAVMGSIGYFAAARTSAPPPATITATVTTSLDSTLAAVAAHRGYLRDEGLDVRTVPFGFGEAAMDAMLRGEADVAVAGETPIVAALLGGQPIVVLTSLFSADRHLGVVARRDRGITAPEALRGKRVGAPHGTVAHFFLPGRAATPRSRPCRSRSAATRSAC